VRSTTPTDASADIHTCRMVISPARECGTAAERSCTGSRSVRARPSLVNATSRPNTAVGRGPARVLHRHPQPQLLPCRFLGPPDRPPTATTWSAHLGDTILAIPARQETTGPAGGAPVPGPGAGAVWSAEPGEELAQVAGE
jgi:hypothetical protein